MISDVYWMFSFKVLIGNYDSFVIDFFASIIEVVGKEEVNLIVQVFLWGLLTILFD